MTVSSFSLLLLVRTIFLMFSKSDCERAEPPAYGNRFAFGRFLITRSLVVCGLFLSSGGDVVVSAGSEAPSLVSGGTR